MSRRLPPLNALRAFEAAGRHESFTRAAAELHVTQGAISRQVQQLESYLGVTLFERHHRALSLTPAGRELLPSLTGAFDSIELGVTRMLRSRRRRGLVVRVAPTFAMRWLMPRLNDFAADHPGIEVQMITTIDDAVETDFSRVDLAIVFGDGRWPGLHHDFLAEEYLLPVCRPDIAATLKSPEDLRHHVLLHTSPSHEDWRIWLEGAGVTGVDPATGPVFDTLFLAMEAAANGVGIAITDTAMLGKEVASGRLAVPFDRPVRSPYGYWLVAPAVQLERERVVLFRNWLLDQVARAVPPPG